MNKPRDLLNALRPQQWIKNTFVFIGLIFGFRSANFGVVLQVLIASLAFCFVSSAVYLVNDMVDIKMDRLHPQKRHRPLAANRVSLPAARILCFLIITIGLGLGMWVSTKALSILIVYATVNLFYSLKLKQVVILDVFIIALGFMLRILIGTVGVGIEPSQWLLLCSLMLTLFLGFAKRRAEIMILGDNKSEHRAVLDHYSPILLDKMITITAACALMSYGLYTMSPDTILRHGTEYLIYTVPFVMYAMFRYIYMLHMQNKGGNPSAELFRDPHILVSVGGWTLLTFWLLY